MLEQFRSALAKAGTLKAIDDVARLMWRAASAGAITEDDASAISEAVEARRALVRSPVLGSREKPPAARARPARAYSKPQSVERRRRLSAAGLLPPQIAAGFTTSETAVLAVIALKVREAGRCALPIDAIAAIAGTCRTVVKNTLRRAAALGLVVVAERRVSAWRNLPNLVSIVSAEWSTWLRLGRGQKSERHGYGFRKGGDDRASRQAKAPAAAPVTASKGKGGKWSADRPAPVHGRPVAPGR